MAFTAVDEETTCMFDGVERMYGLHLAWRCRRSAVDFIRQFALAEGGFLSRKMLSR